jgi:ribosomal protein S18 acetylase RimI-like enzyme
VFAVARYRAARHRPGIRRILEENGWERRYVAGQLAGIDDLAGGGRPGTLGGVFVALQGDPKDQPEDPEEVSKEVSGFVSVELREWNRLGQLQGLAVAPGSRRRGVASALVRRAEEFVRERSGRGVYVDTPVTNETARSFYEALGYALAYTMPDYYDDGLDGVTYLRLFARRRGTRA